MFPQTAARAGTPSERKKCHYCDEDTALQKLRTRVEYDVLGFEIAEEVVLVCSEHARRASSTGQEVNDCLFGCGPDHCDWPTCKGERR